MSLGYDGVGAGVSNALRIYGGDHAPLVSFQTGGNVGIGTTTSPSERLDVAGGRIGGIGDPDSDDDAVNLGSLNALLDARLNATQKIYVSPLKLLVDESDADEIEKSISSSMVQLVATAIDSSVLLYFPLDIPGQIMGVTQRLHRVTISYDLSDAASYIKDTFVKKMVPGGGTPLGMMSESTDQTSTTWTTYTVEDPTPEVIDGSVTMYLITNFDAIGDVISIGSIELEIGP
jgi:hypothetical protein